jgi:hypothetical protein
MKQLIYAMQFKGTASGQGPLVASLTSPSETITLCISGEGVSSTIAPSEGDSAAFKSEVTFLDPAQTAFTESGTITFGYGGHVLHFSTVGQGFIVDSPDPSLKHGTVTWQIDRGEGQFEGAQGLITANFLISGTGAVTDNHFAVLFLP